MIRMIKTKRIGWEGHAAGMGEKWNAYRILVGKPEGKGPEGKGPLIIQSRKWVDNIKMDLKGMGWYGLD
jgi:hypothetical protein